MLSLLPVSAVLACEHDQCLTGDLFGSEREELPLGIRKRRPGDLTAEEPRSCTVVCDFLLFLFLIIKKKYV